MYMYVLTPRGVVLGTVYIIITHAQVSSIRVSAVQWVSLSNVQPDSFVMLLIE